MDFFTVIWGIISKALLENLTGVQGFIGKYVLQYGGKYLYEMLDTWVKNHERQKTQKAAQVELEKKAADPASTADDIGKEYEKTMNSGH